MGSGSDTEEYDSWSQHDLNRWTTLHMVCSVTNATFKNNIATTEVIHPGRSFGDCNETAQDYNTRSWLGSPINPCATEKFMSGNEDFETGQDNSTRGTRGGMVHKVKGIGKWQGPLSNLRELLIGRRTDAIKTRVTRRTEHGARIMVRDLSDRRKNTTDNCHLLQKYTQMSQQLFCNFYRSIGHDERTNRIYELIMDWTPTYRV